MTRDAAHVPGALAARRMLAAIEGAAERGAVLRVANRALAALTVELPVGLVAPPPAERALAQVLAGEPPGAGEAAEPRRSADATLGGAPRSRRVPAAGAAPGRPPTPPATAATADETRRGAAVMAAAWPSIARPATARRGDAPCARRPLPPPATGAAPPSSAAAAIAAARSHLDVVVPDDRRAPRAPRDPAPAASRPPTATAAPAAIALPRPRRQPAALQTTAASTPASPPPSTAHSGAAPGVATAARDSAPVAGAPRGLSGLAQWWRDHRDPGRAAPGPDADDLANESPAPLAASPGRRLLEPPRAELLTGDPPGARALALPPGARGSFDELESALEHVLVRELRRHGVVQEEP